MVCDIVINIRISKMELSALYDCEGGGELPSLNVLKHVVFFNNVLW